MTPNTDEPSRRRFSRPGISHLAPLLFALLALGSAAAQGQVNATFNAPTDIPITAATYSGGGQTLTVTLNFAPSPGTNLTVVHNTGPAFITAPFTNVANGATVNLTYNSQPYPFVAWYYGNAGRDLVLLWPVTQLAGWGENNSGQLADATTTNRLAPVASDPTGVLAGQTIVQVSRGYDHTLALTSNGTVYAWGSDGFGQLGVTPSANSEVPVAVSTASGTSALFGKTVIAISAGQYFSLALCSDGTVASWGKNLAGQCGDNTTTERSVPVAVNTASGTSALFGKTVTAISAGSEHSLALCSDGTVAAWGDDSYGQSGDNTHNAQHKAAVAVNTTSGTSALFSKMVTVIAAGSDHSLALCSDGTLTAWGLNSSGEIGDASVTERNAPVLVSTATALSGKTVTAIAAGGGNSLALCSDGTLAAWGDNSFGELGNNDATLTQQPSPVAVNTASGTSALFGKTVTAIAAGDGHCLALCSDGTIAAWGYDYYGELGDNEPTPYQSSDYQVAPVAVNAAPSVSALAGVAVNALSVGSQASHSAAIYAPLPVNATFNAPTDIPVTASSYDASGNTLNLTLNFAPSPGTNLTVIHVTGPAFIAAPFTNVPNGSTVDLTYNGTAYPFVAWYYGNGGRDLVLLWPSTLLAAWGDDGNGQLGNDAAGALTLAPVPVDQTGVLAGKTVVQVARGAFFTLALTSSGQLYAWGANNFGQLGDNTTTPRTAPVAVNTASGVSALFGKTVVAVSAGYTFSLALCSDGTLAAWGDNTFGELGNNDSAQPNAVAPVAVSAASGVSALFGKTATGIASGGSHNLAFCSDGTAVAWGENGFGELGNNDSSGTSQFAPVAVNMANGTSALFGKAVVGLAAGSYFSVGLCSDGTVAAWGENSGQLGDGTTTLRYAPVAVSTASGSSALFGKTVVAVASGSDHTLALCSDGTLAAWGLNNGGQLGNNDTTGAQQVTPVAVNVASGVSILAGKSVMAIAAGFTHSLALCSDGTVAAWGSDSYGQLGNNDQTQADQFAPVAVNTAAAASALAGAAVSGLSVSSEGDHSVAIYAAPTPVNVSFDAPTDIPITTDSFSGAGSSLNVTLNFTPTPGTSLTVVRNTGRSFITAPFSNVPNGSIVNLTNSGITYPYVAWYYGGSGRDLVLLWPVTGLAAWGLDTFGQLGNDTTTPQRYAPVAVDQTGVLAGQTVVQVSAGQYHSLALTSAGLVYAWGENSLGQLGNGDTTGTTQPAPVAVNTSQGTSALFGKTVVAVAAAGTFSLALCSDGTLAAWGDDSFGELGDNGSTGTGSITVKQYSPIAVNTANGVSALYGKTVSSFAVDLESTVALCTDGTVVCWGTNINGEVGDATTTNRVVPVAVNTASGVSALYGKSVVAVAAGDDHKLALCSDGSVVGWGHNNHGQLGDNTATDRPVPVAVDTNSGESVLFGKTVTAIKTGYFHSLASCSDGTIAVWGYNTDGELGIDTAGADVLAPTMLDTTSGASILSGKTVAAASLGGYFNLALCTDGTLAAWGQNVSGQLGNNDPTGTQQDAPIAVSTTPGVSVLAGVLVSGLPVGNNGTHSVVIFGAPLPPPTPPTVTTLAATNITTTGATLNATVNPEGSATTAEFEYGLTSGYGNTAPITLSPNNGTTAQNVSAMITGLSPGQTYHFNVTATNGGSPVAGSDLTFTTPADITFNAPTDLPIVASSFTAAGQPLNVTLNFAPTQGTNLTVIRDTGTSFITGAFTNLPNGAKIDLTYNGLAYPFIAWYYGGSTGRDLVLLWPYTSLAAWGDDSSGELGDGATTQENAPVAVDQSGVLAGKTIVRVAHGNLHTLALTTEGLVYAWGANFDGQLGDNTTTNRLAPVAVNTASGVSALFGKTVVGISAGFDQSYAVCSDGTVAAWGANSDGELGDNTTTNRLTPVAVNTASGVSALFGKTVVAVSGGNNHTLALCSDGTVAAWGYNFVGQLGNNDSTMTQQNAPVAVSTANGVSYLFGRTVTAIGAGSSVSVALCSDGTVAAWGLNNIGQIGDGTKGTNRLAPVAVSTATALSGQTVTAIAVGGGGHTFALCSNGMLAAWGYDASGELGDNNSGSSADQVAPVAVNTASGVSALFGKTVTSIAAGFYSSAALCSDGTLVSWGQNMDGQIGDNTTTERNAAVLVDTASGVSALAGGVINGSLLYGSTAISSAVIYAPPQPVVATSAATNITPTSATLNASVNPIGQATTAQFLYGLTTDYDSAVNIDLIPDDGSVGQIVSAAVSDLTAGATYHFTVAATGPGGTAYGSDMTFSTPAGVTFNAPTDIPITTPSFIAAGQPLKITLNFAPTAGTNLTVIRNTGTNFISGAFSNLPNGAEIDLTYSGATYRFIAWYYGGAGRDLVLLWQGTGLAAWGNNTYGELGDDSTTTRSAPVAVDQTGVLAGKTIVQVAGGVYHTLALTTEGRVYSWGTNGIGELGDGTATDRSAPVAVDTVSSVSALAGKTVVGISAGAFYNLALCSDGTVAAWGYNSAGQLGNNTTSASNVPVAVSTESGISALFGKTVIAIAAGDTHALALCSDGTVVAWGDNSNGELGDNSGVQQNAPVAVNAASGSALFGKTVVALAAGDGFSLALCSDGSVAAWGGAGQGTLGDNSSSQQNIPVSVNTASGVSALFGKTVTSIAAGNRHSLALCSDGTVAAWGDNDLGQLGNGSSGGLTFVPVPVTTASGLSALFGKTVVAIAAGNINGFALCSDGSLAAWGDDAHDETGDGGGGAGIVRTAPVAVDTMSGASVLFGNAVTGLPTGSQSLHSVAIYAPLAPTVATGAASNVAATSATLNATVNPNGLGATAQFLYGFTTAYGSAANVNLSPANGSNPQSVSALVDSLSPGATYHFAISATGPGGTVIGSDATFSTPADFTFNAPTDVPATASVYDGTGQTLNATLNFAPSPGTNLTVVHNTGTSFINPFINVANGSSVTLTYNGTSYNFIAWYYGGASGRDLVFLWPITSLAAWGHNADGELGDDTMTQRYAPAAVDQTGFLAGQSVVQIARGANHTLALTTAGRVYAWGSNASGQLGNNDATGADQYAPVPVVDANGVLTGKTVVAIGAGVYFSVALCSDGTVFAWGGGDLGNNDSTQAPQIAPVAVNTAAGVSALFGKTVVAIAVGGYHTLALCSDGTLAAWGSNDFSQLGTGAEGNTQVAPVAVNTAAGVSALFGETVTAIAAGYDYSLALCSDGTVAGWGNNSVGQLGNNISDLGLAPTAVNTDPGVSALYGKTVVAIAAGIEHSLALCSDGTVASSGAGALGNNDSSGANQYVPVLVNTAEGVSALYGKTVTAIAAGASHSMALCSDGTLTAWGDNYYGELGNGDPTGATQFAPVVVDTTAGQSVLSAGPVNALSSGSQALHTVVIYGANPPPPPVITSPSAGAAIAIIGGASNQVAVNALTNKAYVTWSGSTGQGVQVINLTTGLVTTINLNNYPYALAVNSAANLIYVSCNQEIDVIDGAADAFVTSIPVQGANAFIVTNPVTNTIYAANGFGASVTVINGATNTKTATLTTNIPSPQAIALNPVTNEIYVPNSDGSLSVINGATNAVANFTLGTGVNPSAVGVDPATNLVYVADISTTPGRLIVVNGASNTVTGTTIPVGAHPASIEVDPRSNQLYVLNRSDQTVTFVYQIGSAILTKTTPVGNEPLGLAFNPSNQLLYVSNFLDNTVSVLDTAARAVVETASVPAGVGGLAVNPLTNQVCTASASQASLSVIDQALFQSEVTLGLAGSLISAAVNPVTNQVYVSEYSAATANGAPGSVVVVDGATNATNTILTGYYASAMAVNPVTNKIYLANVLSFGQQTGITVIDGASNTAQTIAAPVLPYPASNASIAVNPVTNQVYIANGYGASVTVVDGATNAVSTFTAGLIPYAVAVNPVTNMIYVANAGDGTVTILNGATNVTAKVSVGSTPVAVAVNPVTNQIYVANQNSASVTIIDGATNLTASVNVGNQPQSVVVNPALNTVYVGNAADHTVTVINGATNAAAVLSLPTPFETNAASMTLLLDPSNNTVYALDNAEASLLAIDGGTNAMTLLAYGPSSDTPSGGLVVNPATHNVYFGSQPLAVPGLTVIGPSLPAFSAENTLLTTIHPLPQDLLTSGTATVTFSAASTYAPNPTTVQQIYYALDSIDGPWSAVPVLSNVPTLTLTGIPPGLHTLYAFATDGQGSAPDYYRGNALVPGTVASYNFLSTPGAFSFTQAADVAYGTDVSAVVTVQRNFSTPATVSYQTLDDTAVAGTNYVATQGFLSFPAGVMSQMISIPLLNPSGSAGDASFLIQLSNPTGFNVVASPSTARVLILNNSGGVFSDAMLSVPSFVAPSTPPAATGSITVSLTYDNGTGDGQWRLFGELQWRDGGTTATGLVAGNYEVEFKPINSYQAPAIQVIPLTAGQAYTASAEYTSTGAPSVGSLCVILNPNVGGWRRQGSIAWHPSGYVEANLNTGSYILELESVPNFVTPENVEVIVQSGDTSTVGIVYLIPYSASGAGPALVQDPNNPSNLPPANYPGPFPFVGQIQTDVGLGSGFTPMDRIVVTAAHVVFNDETLSYVTGIRWFFQEEIGGFEEPPQVPTGFYVLDGYAAQRASDNTPDVSSPASQQLDVAVLYFMEPTARGGSSGYLASNSPANSWLTGSLEKIILGYPSTGIDPSTIGDLYATAATTAALTNYSGSLFSTTAITSYAGNSGGPLCVQYTNTATNITAYYPAAIYLGGTDATDVRAIDSQVIDLMTRGEVSGNGGQNHVGGGVIVVSAGLSGNNTFALGSLTVTIQPQEVVNLVSPHNAVWELGDGVRRFSGGAAQGLAPGTYHISFPTTITNYNPPNPVTATVQAGGNTQITAVYTPNQPPAITSGLTRIADPARLFTYQITATLEPSSFSATGLPPGLTLNAKTGVISGVPTSSGSFSVMLSASNINGPGAASTLNLSVPLPGQLNVTTVGSGSVPKAFRGSTIQPVGSSIPILATPAKGYLFANWEDLDSGLIVSTQPLYTIPTMPLVLNLQATFVPNPFLTGAYTGLLQGSSFSELGYMRLSLLSTGRFTASFTLGRAATSVKSAFSLPTAPGAPIQFSGSLALPRPDNRVFDLVLTLNGNAITGTLTDLTSGDPLNFSATRPVPAPIPANISALAGSYSAALLLPPTAPATGLPAGAGAASLTVAKSGALHFAGTLGDGVKFSAAGTLDATGSYPFYFLTAGSKTAGPEIALGQISAVLGAKPVQFTSNLNWARNPITATPTPPYAAGFFTRLELTADPSHALTLLGPTAQITFASGDLGANSIVRELNISSKGIVTPASTSGGAFSLTYSTATGLFTGSFLDNGAKRTFTGALLQSQDEGFGFFQEPNGLTGSVLLQPNP